MYLLRLSSTKSDIDRFPGWRKIVVPKSTSWLFGITPPSLGDGSAITASATLAVMAAMSLFDSMSAAAKVTFAFLFPSESSNTSTSFVVGFSLAVTVTVSLFNSTSPPAEATFALSFLSESDDSLTSFLDGSSLFTTIIDDPTWSYCGARNETAAIAAAVAVVSWPIASTTIDSFASVPSNDSSSVSSITIISLWCS